MERVTARSKRLVVGCILHPGPRPRYKSKAPPRVIGLSDAARAPRTPTSPTEKAESLVARLEYLATERLNPRQLQWRKAVTDLAKSHFALTTEHVARVAAALHLHPMGLHAAEAAPLLDANARHLLAGRLSGLSLKDLATCSMVLAQTRVHCDVAPLEDEGDKEPDDPLERDLKPIMNKIVKVRVPPRVQKEQETRKAAAEVARQVLWRRLLPLSLGYPEVAGQALNALCPTPLNPGGPAPSRDELASLWSPGQVSTVLLASGMAWRARGEEPAPELLEGLRVATEYLLGQEGFWRESRSRTLRGHSDREVLACAVGSLGVLQEHGAFELLGEGLLDLAKKRVRFVDFDSLRGVSVPSLVLADMGLRGLGLDQSHFGLASKEYLEELITGAKAPLSRDVCAALLMIRACGRMRPGEPWVYHLVQLAANGLDRLESGGRLVMQSVLSQLAAPVGIESGAPLEKMAQASSFPAGSPEARLYHLAQYDWFHRKNRDHVSWMRCRGALRYHRGLLSSQKG